MPKPSQLVPFTLWGLMGGQVNNVPSPLIPDQGLFDSQNIYLSEGRVIPRPPLVEHSLTGSLTPCNHLAYFISLDGEVRLIRSQIDLATNLVDLLAWDGASWSLLASGLSGSEDTPPSSCMFKGEWLFCPGEGDLMVWTGVGAPVTVASLQADPDLQPPTAPRHVMAALGRIFLADGVDPVTGNRVPYRVWWPTHGDTTIWDHGSRKPASQNASFQDLAHDNTPITGLHFHDGREILAFKPRSVYQGVFNGGVSLYFFEPVSVDIGCVAGRTIKSWRGLCLWLGDGNVFAKPVGQRPIPIGDAIAPHLRELLDGDKAHLASAVLDPLLGIYYLFIPVDGEVYRMFICSLSNKFAWTEGEISNDAIRVMAATEYYSSVGDTRLLLGSRDGKVYELDYSTSLMEDGGVPYEAWFWTKTFDFVDLLQKVGAETAGVQKLSLQGHHGTASGMVRVGPTLAVVETAEATDFGEFDMGQVWSQSYLPGKPNAFRFAQLGARWSAGSATPMPMDGITAWGMPRGDAVE